MKQMSDIFEKKISEQADDIHGVNTINWECSSWKYFSSVDDEQVMSPLHTRDKVYWDSVLCFGKMNENPQSHTVWENRLTWFKSSSEYRVMDRIDDEPMEFEWNIFPRFTTLQLCDKVQQFLSKMSEKPEKVTGRNIFMSMFNDISRGSKDNLKKCESNAQLVSLYAKKFGARQWSYPVECPQSRRRTGQNCLVDAVKIRRKHTPNFPIHESIVQKSAREQKWWKIVETPLCRPNNWNCCPHIFCKSTLSLRGNRRNVWRTWILSR